MIKICEKCDNQKVVNGHVVTFLCIHIMQTHMKILYQYSRSNYISPEYKNKVKEIIKYYELDNSWDMD